MQFFQCVGFLFLALAMFVLASIHPSSAAVPPGCNPTVPPPTSNNCSDPYCVAGLIPRNESEPNCPYGRVTVRVDSDGQQHLTAELYNFPTGITIYIDSNNVPCLLVSAKDSTTAGEVAASNFYAQILPSKTGNSQLVVVDSTTGRIIATFILNLTCPCP